ncbi:MAG TPA: M48 family metallopeptidase [Tenuifilaceae bacterium]|nr:M48 family metallopeptidase [Tenuifilaceae bacterium]
MKKVFVELLILLGIGGILWAIFALVIKLPERPTLISAETEKAIGSKMYNQILEMNGYEAINNQIIDSILLATEDSLMANLPNSQFTYNISIVNSETVNAFALPGGYIIITKKMVQLCDTPEELLSVICHEIGHIEKRHVITRLVKEIGLKLLTSNDSYVSGEIARQLLSQKFNRSQEEEADMFSCSLMLKMGLEPRTLATVFRKLKEQNSNNELQNFELISSHPNLDKRISYVLAYKIPHNFKAQKSSLNLNLLKEEISNN